MSRAVLPARTATRCGTLRCKRHASDWFNYAQFLRKQRRPERCVFACLLHAENTLQSTPGDELRVGSQARKESAAVRSKLDGIVAESLSLQAPAQSAKK
jgi:hypothetical protein